MDRLTTNNEIAGFKFAVIGVLYAVLMAFAVIVVWEKYKDADALVSQEGSAAATIYRLSQGLEPQPRATLRRALTNYLNAVISHDWPAMQDGATSGYSASQNALDAVYAALLPSGASQPPNSEIWLETLRELDTITQARRPRLGAAEGVVPSVIWPALIGGAIITVGFTFFFGAENLRAQMAMTILLSLLVFSQLLIVVTVDYPFSGPIKVEPTALARVLADFGPATNPGAPP